MCQQVRCFALGDGFPILEACQLTRFFVDFEAEASREESTVGTGEFFKGIMQEWFDTGKPTSGYDALILAEGEAVVDFLGALLRVRGPGLVIVDRRLMDFGRFYRLILTQ